MIVINIKQQQLLHYQDNKTVKTYAISTAKNGTGQTLDSYCTPLGRHHIAEKIGQDLAVNAVLVARQATGEIYTSKLGEKYNDRDWILTRILWLAGDEVKNQNTQQRYIYIHGTPDETPMGIAGSRGCIRMRNYDIVELFEGVIVGESVYINDGLEQ